VVARIPVLAFWIALAFAFIMALMPHPPTMPGEPSDKIQHIAAFAVLASLGRIAFRRISVLALAAYLAEFGALIEIVQAIPALHRSSDIMDWIADVAALLIAIGIVGALQSLWSRRARASL